MINTDNLPWQSVDDVRWNWEDYTCGFYCPCGIDIVLTGDGEEKFCDCGRRYRLVSYVQFCPRDN